MRETNNAKDKALPTATAKPNKGSPKNPSDMTRASANEIAPALATDVLIKIKQTNKLSMGITERTVNIVYIPLLKGVLYLNVR